MWYVQRWLVETGVWTVWSGPWTNVKDAAASFVSLQEAEPTASFQVSYFHEKLKSYSP